MKSLSNKRVRFLLPSHSNEDVPPLLANNKSLKSTPQARIKVLTEAICKRVWYQPDEIADFKLWTRKLIVLDTTHHVDDQEDLCGLERYHPERALHRHRVLQYILQAQQHQKNPEFLRHVSEKATEWARKMAVSKGFADFCDVYSPWESIFDTAGWGNLNYVNSQQRGKRPSNQSASSRKRVRHRRSRVTVG